ncbi:hypothetical protein EmuJ_000334800 [Echinococcus multilocularis]|uniref:Uncharacterized protein n=1 Tax=Echinococcus multilocularis TaxID=6211 RepID=A0A068XV79_ECHMU|nr:hypothetical protein EmuJ_000334800 [Echinococcus multilocularis]
MVLIPDVCLFPCNDTATGSMVIHYRPLKSIGVEKDWRVLSKPGGHVAKMEVDITEAEDSAWLIPCHEHYVLLKKTKDNPAFLLFYVPGFRASPPIIRCLIDKMHNCML